MTQLEKLNGLYLVEFTYHDHDVDEDGDIDFDGTYSSKIRTDLGSFTHKSMEDYLINLLGDWSIETSNEWSKYGIIEYTDGEVTDPEARF